MIVSAGSGLSSFANKRRPSFPQGGFDTRKSRQDRSARGERRRTIPVCQLPESDEDGEDTEDGDSDDEDEDEEGGDYGRRGREVRGEPVYHRRGLKKPRSPGGGVEAHHARGCPLFSSNRRQRLLTSQHGEPPDHVDCRGGERSQASAASSSSPNLLQPPPSLALANSSSFRCPNPQCRCGLLEDEISLSSALNRNNNNEKFLHRGTENFVGEGLVNHNAGKGGSQHPTDNLCIIHDDDDDENSPGRQHGRGFGAGIDGNNTHRDKDVEKDGGEERGGEEKSAQLGKPDSKHDLHKRSSEQLHTNNSAIKKARKKRRSRETVILNVGGQTFETYRSTLRRLRTPIFDSDAAFQRYFRRSHGDYFFDRDATAFGSVLNFLRTGELHIPTNMCGPALQNELEFWGIEEVDIARCCWTQYNTWKTQCRSLEKLEYDRKFSTTQQVNTVDPDASAWTQFRARVWTLLQDPGSSRKAKVYAWVSIIFVFVSIFSFCAETHPLFKVKAKDVTHLASFYQFFNVEPIQFGDLDPDGNNTMTNGSSFSGNRSWGDFGGFLNTSRQNETLAALTTPNSKLPSGDRDNHPDTGDGERNSDEGDFCDEEDDDMSRGGSGIGGGMRPRTEDTKCVRKSSKKVRYWGDRELPHPALLIMDVCCLAFFTLEYVTRFTCSPNKMDFVRALQNIVDFLAFAPDYVEIMFLIIGPGQGKEGVAVMEMLFILRILRLFRIFRLIRHVPGLWILLYTLKASFNELMLMCVFLLIGMVVFATLIHFAEPEGIFTNIPVGFWWAVVTMTTVGYGDMYPQSPAGYFIGSCCAVAGLLMIAFTVPIIVSNFVLYYTHVQYGLARRDRELEKILEEEMEDELDMLDASRSHLNIAVYGKGETTGPGGKGDHHHHKHRNRDSGDLGSTKSLIPTIFSKAAHLESPCLGKRKDRANSSPYSLMPALVTNSLHKKPPSSSRESMSSSKVSACAVVLPPPPPPHQSKESKRKTEAPLARMPPSLSSSKDTNLTVTPAKSAQLVTTVRNGKCYMGVTSKSDTDLSPSRGPSPSSTTAFSTTNAAGNTTTTNNNNNISSSNSRAHKTPSPLTLLRDGGSTKAKDSDLKQLKKGQRGNRVKDTNTLGGLELGIRDKSKDYKDGRRGSCTVVLLDDDHVV